VGLIMGNKFRYYFISVMIAFIVLIFLPSIMISETHLKSELGKVSLEKESFSNKNLINLDGEWQYTNDSFIITNPALNPDISIVNLPSKYIRKNNSQSAYKGYGSISLEALLPDEEKIYGLDIEYIATAYRVYVDGVMLGQVGNPTESLVDSAELYCPLTVYFKASGETRIDIEFSNHSDNYTFLKNIKIGSKEGVERYKLLLFSRDLISIALIVFLSAFGLGYHFIRQKDKRALYFAILCLNFGIRGLVVNERILNQILPNISWDVFLRIGYVPLFFGMYIFLEYLKFAVEGAFPPGYEKTIKTISIVFTIASFVLPDEILTVYMLPATLLLYLTIVLVSFFRALLTYRKDKVGITVLVSLGFLLAIVAFDILANYTPISIPYFNALGLMVFFLFQAGDLGREFGQAFLNAEELGVKNKQLADDLVMLNASLEELVEKRTTDLILRTEELEISNNKLRGMNKHLENLSFIDELTKIPNRRMFFSEIDKSYYVAQRENRTMVLMLIDIDHFKKYNDIYGHVKGDWCLFNIAQTIEQISTDYGFLAARYGGEEFIIAGFDISREKSIEVGEAVRATIAEMEIIHGGNDASDYITVSIGAVYCELSLEEAIMTIVKKQMIYFTKQNHQDVISF